MTEYVDLQFTPQPSREPFRFRIAEDHWEEKFELPALDDPGLPIDLLPLAMIALDPTTKSDAVRGREALVTIMDHINAEHPQIVRALNRHTQTYPLLLALIEAWAAHSNTSPKA